MNKTEIKMFQTFISKMNNLGYNYFPFIILQWKKATAHHCDVTLDARSIYNSLLLSN